MIPSSLCPPCLCGKSFLPRCFGNCANRRSSRRGRNEMPMTPRGLRLVRRRLLQAVPVLVFVILGTFLLLAMAPGDAVDAYLAGAGGGGADFAQRLRQEWGLGGSLGAQLLAYLARLATLDLGW